MFSSSACSHGTPVLKSHMRHLPASKQNLYNALQRPAAAPLVTSATHLVSELVLVTLQDLHSTKQQGLGHPWSAQEDYHDILDA
jgi:hypothetical protein